MLHRSEKSSSRCTQRYLPFHFIFVTRKKKVEALIEIETLLATLGNPARFRRSVMDGLLRTRCIKADGTELPLQVHRIGPDECRLPIEKIKVLWPSKMFLAGVSSERRILST